MKEKDLSMKVSLILYQKNQSNNTQACLCGNVKESLLKKPDAYAPGFQYGILPPLPTKSPRKSNDPQKRLPGKTWKPFFPLKHQYIIKYILKY